VACLVAVITDGILHCTLPLVSAVSHM
jgi:hypothetical protein